MREEKEIFQDIVDILYSEAPENAEKIRFIAELSIENDYFGSNYTSITRGTREEVSFIIKNNDAKEYLRETLIELRELTAQRWLSGPGRGQSREKAYWLGCIITYNIEEENIELELKYELGEEGILHSMD